MFRAIRTKKIIAISFLISAMVLIQFDYLSAQTPFKIEIGDMDSVARGANISVPVYKTAGSEEMQGFEFLIAHDNDAMKFLGVTPGDLFDGSGTYQWEYLSGSVDSIIYPTYGHWDTLYPPRIGYMARISATADLNNGAHHPSELHIPDSTILFYLNYHISFDIFFTCQYPLIRFYWSDCRDNTVPFSGQSGTRSAISKDVFDYGGYIITDPSHGLPSFRGAPNICLDSSSPPQTSPIRFVDYYNDLIIISCDSTNPLRGDVNLNGIPYELADAATLSEYFLHRESAFGISVDSQRNASDINGDLRPAGISDYIYLSAIVSGEMTPNQSVAPGALGFLYVADSGLSVKLKARFGIPVGGIELCFYASDPAPYGIMPLSHAAGMDLTYSRIGNYLRVLIHTDMTLGYPRDYIDTGYGEILQISYANRRPILISADAAGFYAETIELSYPTPADIDTRGDINLNGIPYEIGDVVTFENYFLQGLSAFTIHEEGQSAASDVNADGIPLTVEDYAYLWGVIKGIFVPLPKWKNEFSGILSITETDSSLIISGDFEDSVSVLLLSFYAPGLEASNGYRVHPLSGVDYEEVYYGSQPAYYDDTIKILISPSLYDTDSSLVTIDSGMSDIVEIVSLGVKPEFITASAAGSLAQHVYLAGNLGDNNPPAFPTYPGNLVNDYYGAFHFDFDAVDQNPIPDRITYQILSGPGEIDPITGIWTYAPLCKNIGETYTLTICASDRFHPCPQADSTLHATVQLTITNQPPLVGDADHSGGLNMLDITYLINFLYRHGSPPVLSIGVGDVNGNGIVNILDITYMINHLFKNGPAPICL